MPGFETYKDISYQMNVNRNGGSNIKIWLYAVDGLLIDCGPTIMEKELTPFMLNTSVNQLAITHLHEDHSGNAAWVQDNLRVPIYMHPGDIAEAAADGYYTEGRLMTWGLRKGITATPMPDVLETEKHRFNVISTPGHMDNHYVFHEPDMGWIFSGDLYVAGAPRLCGTEENMSTMISSLQKVLELDFDTLFCAHAGIFENGKDTIREKLDYLLGIRERVREGRRKGMTDEEIDHEIFPRRHILTDITEGAWASINIIKTL